MRGFLNIDKPSGITSFDVVRAIRRAAHLSRVGHAGTLDPLATGVLPVALGDATRLIDEVMGTTKRYRAEVLLGRETDSYDRDGAVLAERDASGVTLEAVRLGLRAFTGEFLQAPPAFSAIKRAGEPAYRAARRGAIEPLPPRPVRVYALEATALVPEGPCARLTLEVECGQGFYVRSLAHDLGAALGTGGTIDALRRTRVGTFLDTDAISLDEAVRALETGDSSTIVRPPDAVLGHLPRVDLSEHEVVRARNGQVLRLERERLQPWLPESERIRCYGPDQHLVGIARSAGTPDDWHPFRVFPPDRT